jgi:hypothetical protein
MADDVEIIAAELRLKLDEMENDALIAQKRMEHYAKVFAKQGEHGGKLYVKGFNKGSADLNRRLNDFVGALSGISPKMGALGEKMAKVFSGPILSSIPMITSAFQSIIPVIGPIIAAFTALVAVVKKGISVYKEHKDKIEKANAAIKDQKMSVDLLKISIEDYNRFANQMSEAEQKEIDDRVLLAMAVEKQEEILQKLRNAYSAYERELIAGNETEAKRQLAIHKENHAIYQNLILLNKHGIALAEEMVVMGLLDQTELERRKGIEKTQKTTEDYIKLEIAYKNTLEDIAIAKEKDIINEEERAQAEMSANRSFLNGLIAARNAVQRNTIIAKAARGEQVAYYDELIAKQAALYDDQKKQAEDSNELTMQKKIDKDREAAEARYAEAVRKTEDAYKAGLIDEIALHDQLAAALATEYADMEAIVAQYKLSWGKTIDTRDVIAEQVKLNRDNAAAMAAAKKRLDEIDKAEEERAALLVNQEDALAQQAILRAQETGEIDLAVRLENELIEKQRQREREALTQTAAYIEAKDREREEILKNFDKITEGMKKVQEEAEKTSIFDGEAFQRGMQIGEAAISAFDSISSQALDISRKHAEEQIAIIDAALERTKEQIEESRQMELEAEGFIEAQSEEQIQKQIDAAKQAGDEVLQYQLERRLKEKEINDRFDAQAKAEEEKAAREKAQIEYQAAKEEFALNMIQAVNAGAMAVLRALASAAPPYNFILAGVAGAATAAQISLLAANPPKPPAFADGGIVPGRKADGDTKHIIATAGELILNEAQQENVAEKLTGGGETVVNTYLVVNDEVIGKSSARYANTRGAVYERRAIMGLR